MIGYTQEELFIGALISRFKELSQEERCILWEKIIDNIKKNKLKLNDIINNIYKLFELSGQKYNLSNLNNKNILWAKNKSTSWLKEGVFILSPYNTYLPWLKELNPPLSLLWAQTKDGKNTLKLFNSPTAAVLNSRKLRYLTPTTRWLKVTRKLTEYIINKQFIIISSLGALAYEIVCFLANKKNSFIIIILDEHLPAMMSSKTQRNFYTKFIDIFNLDKTIFISPFWPETKLPPQKQRFTMRDYLVISLAEYIFIAEIRKNGNMQKLISMVLSKNKNKKIKVFQPVKFDKFTTGNRELLLMGAERIKITDIDSKPTKQQILIKKTLKNFIRKISFELDEYLFHYTRGLSGRPWPGQRLVDYISSLIEEVPDSAHTAFDTLCRIIKEKRIRASDKLVRGNIPVVSFTACLPEELSKLRKWQPALIRWTFEPYGIGLKKETLEKLGAKPVIYASEKDFKQLKEEDRFRFQLHQPPKTDWSSEKEWRIVGDVLLHYFIPHEIIIIVPTLQEAAKIIEEFSLPVYILSLRKEEN